MVKQKTALILGISGGTLKLQQKFLEGKTQNLE